MAELTPMMKQYLEIKEQNKDSILFFRLGDFYEMFGADARTASRELDLTLTTRDKDKNKSFDEKVPMCGVPYHSSDGYIARLIAKGYKVAICEQTEDPATAKGLVKRDIIRVVTPGTVLDDTSLEAGRSNFCAAAWLGEDKAGFAACDISTGQTHATAFSGPDAGVHLLNEVARFSPAEIILNDAAARDAALQVLTEDKLSCHREIRETDGPAARTRIAAQFGEQALSDLPADNYAPVLALGNLLNYLHETQRGDLHHIDTLDFYRQGQFMELDISARRNLELTETLRSKEKKGSLLWVLDKTKTAMGARMLRSWLERPLLSVRDIDRRADCVERLVNDTVTREELVLALSGISDMERLMSRIVYGSAGGRDVVALRTAMEKLPAIKALLAAFPKGRLHELYSTLDTLDDLAKRIADTLRDEPPFSVREGEFIRDGFHPEVDRLRGILHGGKGLMTSMEAQEKEKTVIRTLKIGYNKVFGYYIEVSNSFKDQVPDTYIRKQTLVNGERYITQELKDMEHTILSAQDRIVALEYQLFCDIRDQVAAQSPRIQEIAGAVAQVDVLVSFATVAAENNYCMPTVDNSDRLEITEGRHPVVEKMRRDVLFVPNDTYMDNKEHLAAILTGPNMAGKSTYMRQVALMVLMAQMGSFVPARAARIGVVDRIFTRIGASDDLAGGQSTFMVEMTEVAELLKHATSRSLLILDEIGRGTSTYDGMSIARAVLEWCADPKRLGAKTLFATHYHELTVLEGALPGVKNFNIAARKKKDEILFLRKIVPGGADQSYGIEVANLAGLPPKVIRRAREILAELESQDKTPKQTSAREEPQVSLTALGEEEVLATLRNTQLESLTPLQAMNLLYELKAKL